MHRNYFSVSLIVAGLVCASMPTVAGAQNDVVADLMAALDAPGQMSQLSFMQADATSSSVSSGPQASAVPTAPVEAQTFSSPLQLISIDGKTPGSPESNLIEAMKAMIATLTAKLQELLTARSVSEAQVGLPEDTRVFKRVLDIGARGDDVLSLQQLLSDRGFFTDVPTGYFGPKTKEAVRLVQAQNSIEPLGSVGLKTLELLNEMIAPPPEIEIAPATSSLQEIVPTAATTSAAAVPSATTQTPSSDAPQAPVQLASQ